MILPQPLPPFPLIGPDDRVLIDGVAFRCLENEPSYLLSRVDDPRILNPIDRPTFAALTATNRYRLDRNFFSAGATKARFLTGNITLAHLNEKDRTEVMRKFFICKRFEQMARAGRTSRSSDKMTVAIQAIFQTELAEQLQLTKLSGDTIDLKKPPSHWTLLDWLVRLDACGWEPISLLDNRSARSGNRTSRIQPDVLKLLVKYRAEFLNTRQPTYDACHRELVKELEAINVVRIEKGLQPLARPSIEKFSSFVKELDAFELYAGRHGKEAAKKKYYAASTGQHITAIGQVIEMDEWEVQLHILLIESGLWDELTEEQQKAVETGRWFLCVAIDAATRAIMGMSLSRTASAENALRTLEMVCRDKTHLAIEAGAQSTWHHRCGPGFVRTDNGSSFIASIFRIAVTLLYGTPDLTPAAIPELRGRIERVFSTMHKNLIGNFDGRTFSDVVQGAHYPSQKLATLTIDELARVVVRWAVDCYHNRPHEGLEGLTPNEVWSKLSTAGGAVPTPDAHTLRVTFGRKVERRITAYGVDFMKLHYGHPALQEYRRVHGDGATVTVSADLFDLGYISVLIEEDVWIDVPCSRADAHGVSVAEWVSTKRQIDLALAAGRTDTDQVLSSGFESIRVLREQSAGRRHIASTTMSNDEFEQLVREMDIGSKLPEPPQTDAPDPGLGPLAGGYVVSSAAPSPAAIESEPSGQPAPPTAVRKMRSSSSGNATPVPSRIVEPTAPRRSRLEEKK